MQTLRLSVKCSFQDDHLSGPGNIKECNLTAVREISRKNLVKKPVYCYLNVRGYISN